MIKDCPMRNEKNGNCLPMGGFCMANSKNICEALQNAYDMGKRQPEIIRCKDCKQCRRWNDTCFYFCDITELEVRLDGFCSLAERRTDD